MHTSLELDAARLAVLAARASISREIKLRPTHFRLPLAHDRLTSDEIAQRLLVAPKPLLCTARDAGGTVEITYRPLEPGTHHYEWHERLVKSAEERGGFMSYVPRSTDDSAEDLKIYCVGWDEWLLLSIPAVEQWRRDYEVHANMRGDVVDNPLCTEEPEYRDAKTQGAAGLIIFSSPGDSHG